jgi:hypothetical protein
VILLVGFISGRFCGLLGINWLGNEFTASAEMTSEHSCNLGLLDCVQGSGNCLMLWVETIGRDVVKVPFVDNLCFSIQDN